MVEVVSDMQKFWTSAKISAMNRQPGLEWESIGRMDIAAFLHVLTISEKNEIERARANKTHRKNG